MKYNIKLRCVDNSGSSKDSLILGKEYLAREGETYYYIQLDEKGNVDDGYFKSRFEFVEELVKTNFTNKYLREIKPGVWVDIYDVLNAWKVTDPCLQHAAKKVLQAGDRGHKDRLEDLQDIVDSTQRAIEMHREWNKE